ncbi:hypothetical protein ACERK3_11800 [Phycisphaerales bacterium AB-hyl4]|uniref:Transmembrane protein n=1 Tax=Natronomicrosphaera hydrolytica TaxID=3242702 RepID=A0ABV4U5V0_9BACT
MLDTFVGGGSVFFRAFAGVDPAQLVAVKTYLESIKANPPSAREIIETVQQHVPAFEVDSRQLNSLTPFQWAMLIAAFCTILLAADAAIDRVATGYGNSDAAPQQEQQQVEPEQQPPPHLEEPAGQSDDQGSGDDADEPPPQRAV